MKKILLLMVLAGMGLLVSAQGITFEHGTWKDALARAKKEKKMIFVDFYTSWCGPCKDMSQNIMTKPEAGELYNREFVNFKQDAEKGEGPGLAKQYRVTAYPTFIFVDHRGDLIYKFLGRRELDGFLAEGQKALKTYRSLPLIAKMGKEYKRGKRDTAFLREYYETLKGRGEGEGVLNDYLKALPDNELLTSRYLPEISLYDKVLYDRLLEGWRRLDPVKDKKVEGNLNSAIMKALGGCLQSSLDNNREDVMEELLVIKKELGDAESPLSQMMGGGTAYMATPQLRLNFYMQHKADEKFRALLEDYMSYTMDTITKQNEIIRKGFLGMADSLKNDVKKQAEMKRMMNFLGTINSLKYKVLAAAVFNYTGHYWDIAPAKDAAIKAKCEEWLLFVSQLEPSMAGGGAEVLVKLDEKNKAVRLLEQSIKKLEADEKAEPGDLQKLKAQLEEMRQ